jgi:hypothetical protein
VLEKILFDAGFSWITSGIVQVVCAIRIFHPFCLLHFECGFTKKFAQVNFVSFQMTKTARSAIY